MLDEATRDSLTLILVADALEAHGGHRGEAVIHLLDAAGTLIVDAHRKDGCDARSLAQRAAQYLIDQVTFYTGEAE